MSKSKSQSVETKTAIDESGQISYLSLGSNVGDRKAYLKKAVELLQQHDKIRILKLSSIYESQPMVNEDQPFFLNMVTAIATELEPAELLQTIKAMEQELGRVQREEKGPREIDIDIIFYSDLTMDSDDLTIPHKEHHNRKFVLVPLSHIAPDFVCPVHQLSIEDALKQSSDGSYIHLFDPAL